MRCVYKGSWPCSTCQPRQRKGYIQTYCIVVVVSWLVPTEARHYSDTALHIDVPTAVDPSTSPTYFLCIQRSCRSLCGNIQASSLPSESLWSLPTTQQFHSSFLAKYCLRLPQRAGLFSRFTFKWFSWGDDYEERLSFSLSRLIYKIL